MSRKNAGCYIYDDEGGITVFIYAKLTKKELAKLKERPYSKIRDHQYIVGYFSRKGAHEGVTSYTKVKQMLKTNKLYDIKLGYEKLKKKIPNLNKKKFNNVIRFCKSQLKKKF